MKLTIALSTLLYKWHLPLKEAVKKISSLNYDGIEIRAGEPDISTKNLTSKKIKEFKRLIDKYDLEVISLTPDWIDLNLASSNPEIRKKSVSIVKEYLRMASDFGAQYFTILPGKKSVIATPPIEKCREWSLESLEECVSLAESLNITLCLEAAPGQVMEKEGDLIDFVTEINSRYLLIAADTSHAYVLSEPVHYFKKLKDYIGIVHIADTDGTPNAHLPPGLGKVDFIAVFLTLRQINYNGDYMLEIWYPKDPDWAAKHSKAFITKLLE